MIETLQTLWRVKEIRTKILFTLWILMIHRLGTFVPLPGVDGNALGDMYLELTGSVGGATDTAVRMIQLFSGGALFRFSVFALGIMPYISASIIMQLLVATTPSLKAMQEEGPAGQERIKMITRWVTIAICLVQGVVFIGILSSFDKQANPIILDDSFMWRFQTLVTWTAGTMFVMWLGDQISWRGIGNGPSLIIMAGIVVELPAALVALFSPEALGEQRDPAMVVLVLGVYLAMIVGIVFITLAQRRIPIHMAKHVRGMRMSLGDRNFLPLRVNQAGVMPVIFASVVMQFVGILFNFLSTSVSYSVFNPLSSQLVRGANFGYVVVEVGLIIFFAYFYTAMQFNPKEMSENLKKQGHFIPGIRPGKHTSDFLEKVMNRVVLPGAVFLAIIDIVPVVATGSGLQSLVASFMGGTGLLIVVGVALDLMQKLETEITMRNYQGFMKQRRNRRTAS